MRIPLLTTILLCSCIIHISAQKTDSIYKTVDVKPTFSYKGCNNTNDCVLDYFETHAKWPSDDDVQGTIYIQCVVEKNGDLSHFKVLRGLESKFDAESINVLNSMPAWKPGRKNGKVVRTEVIIPVRWKLY